MNFYTRASLLLLPSLSGLPYGSTIYNLHFTPIYHQPPTTTHTSRTSFSFSGLIQIVFHIAVSSTTFTLLLSTTTDNNPHIKNQFQFFRLDLDPFIWMESFSIEWKVIEICICGLYLVLEEQGDCTFFGGCNGSTCICRSKHLSDLWFIVKWRN